MAADKKNPTEPTAETSVSDTVPKTFDPGFRHPTQVGPYKILELLGEGGMGAVYLAEQERPVRRRVALKLIKLGMDTREIIARFESERQALAMMNHPSIARVFDAGATESGRPYFVMEHVAGVPITEYCDTHRLATRQRLDLFMQVCHAVQHAHQKGIIHRDIKPSNVLVMFQDEGPIPKIIDFGIARATDRRLTDNTMHTEHGRLIGTPEYMSPEQAEMTGLDIDTRTDVYSLGVLLYELLVGTLPFETQGLRRQGPNAMRQQIREHDPPKPSTRLSTLGKDSQIAAQKRQTDARGLVKQIRGDLDWITMKSMEKDRTLRYPSAAELAGDIGRFLNDEPVTAGPPGAAYRLKKLVRKHRRVVGAAVAVMLALIVGFAMSTVLYFKAERETEKALAAQGEAQRERDAAEQARIAEAKQRAEADQQRDAAIRSTKLAEAETAKAKAIDDFLDTMLSSLDKEQLRVTDVMERASSRIDAIFADQPEMAATLRQTIGKTYFRLGLYPSAEPLVRSARDLRLRVLGPEHRDTLKSMSELGCLLIYNGKSDEAEPLLKNALESQKKAFGEDDPLTLETVNTLAGLSLMRGKLDEAEAAQRRVLEKRRRLLGDEHFDTLNSMNNLATTLQREGKYSEAEALLRKTLEISERKLGEKHPDTLVTMRSLSEILQAQSQFGEAETLARRALEAQKRVLGEEHPNTVESMSSLASLLVLESKFPEAESLLRRARDISEHTRGPEHPSTLALATNLANVFREEGKLADAESLCRHVLAARHRLLGDDNLDTLTSMDQLARILWTKGDMIQAEPIYRSTLDARARVQGNESVDTLTTMNDFASLLYEEHKLDEAEPLLRKALKGRTNLFGESNAQTLTSMHNLATLLLVAGRLPDAEPLMRRTLELRERLLGEANADTLATVSNLASLVAQSGNSTEAEALFRRALDGKRHVFGADFPDTIQAGVDLAEFLLNFGRYEDSGSVYRTVLESCGRRHDEHGSAALVAMSGLGAALTAKGKFDDAESPLMKAIEGMRATPTFDRGSIRVTLERLVRLYQKWGNEEKADHYRAQLTSLGK